MLTMTLCMPVTCHAGDDTAHAGDMSAGNDTVRAGDMSCWR